jgi:hypothetical protein
MPPPPPSGGLPATSIATSWSKPTWGSSRSPARARAREAAAGRAWRHRPVHRVGDLPPSTAEGRARHPRSGPRPRDRSRRRAREIPPGKPLRPPRPRARAAFAMAFAPAEPRASRTSFLELRAPPRPRGRPRALAATQRARPSEHSPGRSPRRKRARGRRGSGGAGAHEARAYTSGIGRSEALVANPALRSPGRVQCTMRTIPAHHGPPARGAPRPTELPLSSRAFLARSPPREVLSCNPPRARIRHAP